MENFIVSARKYRPATFDTVVGQRSITTTLKNAIKTNHLAHAYLFCGPRGVGKTTCARIFAKTINCLNLTAEVEACDKCESCVSFNNSRSYNIHELDAASNNSVEDIRTLTEQVRIPPQIGTHSVYIIDEVHMLSSAAFNAFLKTLEEPPAHAIFILATTEKHKIIPTILSRCQIFDFNRIKVEDIVGHLANVASKEQVDADLDGLNVIAQKADGGMRDALSYFDQIVSFSGNKVSYKNVIDNLNVLDYDYYFKITSAFLTGNITDSLLIFNEILENGFDGHHFISGLSGHFRDILVCKDAATIELLEVGATIRQNYKKQAENCSVEFLFKAIGIANSCDLTYRESRNKRLQVELALMQMCQLVVSISNRTSQEKATVQNQTISENQSTYQTKQTQQVQQVTNQVPQQKTNVVKETLPGNSISIKNFLTSQAVKKEEAIQEIEDKKLIAENSNSVDNSAVFNEDEMKVKWLEYANSLKSVQPRLHGMLSSVIPVLKEACIIEIPLFNQLQIDEINPIKTDIITFLRRELNNSRIDLHVVIVQQPEKKKLYTEADKYKFLIEKNPYLNKLKQQLNLDF